MYKYSEVLACDCLGAKSDDFLVIHRITCMCKSFSDIGFNCWGVILHNAFIYEYKPY